MLELLYEYIIGMLGLYCLGLLVNLASLFFMKICDPITNQQYKGCVIPMSNVTLIEKSKKFKTINFSFREDFTKSKRVALTSALPKSERSMSATHFKIEECQLSATPFWE